MDERVLQYLMGHTDLTMTKEVYNHVDMVRAVKEVKRASREGNIIEIA